MAIVQNNPFQIIKQIFGGKSVQDEINTDSGTGLSYAERKYSSIAQQNIHTRLAFKTGGLVSDSWKYSTSNKITVLSDGVTNTAIYDSFDCANTTPSDCVGTIDSLTVQFSDYSVTSSVPVSILWHNKAGQSKMESLDITPSLLVDGKATITLDADFDPEQDVIFQVGYGASNVMAVNFTCTVSQIA